MILKIIFPIEKVLGFPNGWDTLNIFASHSFGGVPRKDFLRLYKESKNRRIASDEYTLVEYGSLEPTNEQFKERFKRAEKIKKNGLEKFA